MKLYRILSMLICLSIIVCSFSFEVSASKSQSTPDFNFDCRSVILMEANTGSVLYEMNADEALPPASVTKIMTLLLVMEAIDDGRLSLTDTVIASANACSMGGSQVYLKEGEQMSVEDMLKSVVIASANDAAVALAEHIAGTEEAFVDMMNQKARALGLTSTNFENTNGLDDTAQNHVTSARDIAIMSRELIAHKKILEYSSIWMDSIRNGEFGLTNTNRLIRFYKGATGLKTGSTAKAKFCVSATAERDGMSLICVVMAAPTRDIRNSIATSLLDYGFSNYALYRNEKSEISDVRVVGGVKESCSVKEVDFCKVLSKNEASKITRTVELEESVAAPVNEGDRIGRCVYRFGDTVIGESDIVATETVNKIDFVGLLCRMLAKMVLC